jgi:hypothetical protein
MSRSPPMRPRTASPSGSSSNPTHIAPIVATRKGRWHSLLLIRTSSHFVGQSTILSLTADQGTGEAYCLAHHLTVDGGKRRLMIAALRYYDTFAKMDGAWLFAERLLYVDWIEERVLSR